MPNLKHLYLCLSMFAIILFFNNNNMALWEQDEAAYAGFAQTMNRTGDYLIPNFIWSDQHRKTPFHFWTIATSYKLFGEHEFATRLPTNLALILLAYFIYFSVKRLINKEQGIISAIVFTTGLIPILYGKIAFTDGLLLCFEGISLLSYLLWFKEKKLQWLFILNIAISLALLTKGPPILMMMGSMIGLQIIFGPNRAFAIKSIFYLIPSLFPMFYWLYQIHLVGRDDFLSWLLDWYVLKRTSGTVFGQTGPVGYFALLFLLSLILFSPFIIDSIRSWWERIKQKEELSLLMLYALPGAWWLYEFLPSKLPSYALAAYPILSIGLGRYLSTSIKKNKIFPIILLIGLIVAFFVPKTLPNNTITYSLQGSIILFFITLALFTFLKNSQKYIYNGVGLIVFFLLSLNIYSLEKDRNYTATIADKVKNINPKITKIYFSKNFEIPGIAVYLQRNNIEYQLDTSFQNKGIYLADNENIHLLPNMTKIDSIQGWISDRGKFATFYLLQH